MNLEQLIKQKIDILDNFDFHKVHAYMLLTKWQWWDTNEGQYYQPSIEQLKASADYTLDRAINCEQVATSQGCGGFMVYKFNYGLRLTFEPFYKSGY